MPYSSIKDIPSYLSKYSLKKRRMWMHVFNSTYAKVLKETGSKKSAEERAFMAANSRLKAVIESHSSEIDYKHDYFASLTDEWLKK